VSVFASKLTFVIKRSWTEVSLLQIERAIQRAREKGSLVLGRRGIVTRLGFRV
ncbi:unnamed protein product, partial [Staurois parvus]